MRKSYQTTKDFVCTSSRRIRRVRFWAVWSTSHVKSKSHRYIGQRLSVWALFHRILTESTDRDSPRLIQSAHACLLDSGCVSSVEEFLSTACNNICVKYGCVKYGLYLTLGCLKFYQEEVCRYFCTIEINILCAWHKGSK